MACNIQLGEITVDVIQSFTDISNSIDEEVNKLTGNKPKCHLACGFLPDPIWPGTSIPTWEKLNMTGNITMEGIKAMVKQAIEPLTSLSETIGLTLPEMPTVPGFDDMSFDEFITSSFEDLQAKADIEALKSALSSIIPDPIYGKSMSSPMQEIADYISAAMNNYMVLIGSWFIGIFTDLVSTIEDFIQATVDIEIPTMPEIPDFSEIFSNPIEYPDPMDYINNELVIDFGDLVEEFKLMMPTSPTEMCAEYDLAQVCKNYYAALSSKVMELVLSWWEELKALVDSLFPDLIPDLVPVLEVTVPMIYGVEEEVIV